MEILRKGLLCSVTAPVQGVLSLFFFLSQNQISNIVVSDSGVQPCRDAVPFLVFHRQNE